MHKVATLLAEHHITPDVGPMLCGLSGGADSVALILVLKELGYRVMAMHCNFQLRGEESERDEQFVRDFCTNHGITLRTTRFDTRAEAEAHGESIEMAARRLRYEWFERVLKELLSNPASTPPKGGRWKGAICVAHHADDNVETMLLNLIRGAGLHGLTGMEFCNDWGVLRPLLCVTRAEILDYLAAKGETFVTDSSNTDTHYRRNKVRHELLPLLREMNPSIDRTLTETMFRLQQAEDMLLYSNHDDTYRLRRQLMDYGFSMTQIMQMENARNGAVAVTTHCPKCIGEEVMLTKHRGEYIVGRVPKPVEPTPLCDPITYVEGGTTSFDDECRTLVAHRMPLDAVVGLKDKRKAVLDVRALKGRLYVRSVREGDRFTPFGMKGTKLVSDYMTDRHRSRLDKLAALVVCDDNGILWLVGETVDQRAAVNETTTEVLVVKIDLLLSQA